MKWLDLCRASLLILLCASMAHAQLNLCPPVEQNPRTQSLTVYLWVPGQHGDAIIRGTPVNVDTSISDSWDNLWDNFEGAFSAHYENSKLPWTYIVDVLYLRLENTVNTQQYGPLTFTPTNWLAEAAVTYAVSASPACTKHPYRTEVLGGLRYTSMELEISDITGAKTSGRQDWIDPFIGARYSKNFSSHWGYSVRGDVGGFGVGDHISWNAILTLEDVLSPQWALDAGWRWLTYDYDNGEGPTRFQYDVTQNGPFIGTTYRF